MYHTLIRIVSFEITTFGLMMFVAFIRVSRDKRLNRSPNRATPRLGRVPHGVEG